MRPDATPRFVVTGAAGFIGSHLVRHARHAGHPVLAIVRSEVPDTQQVPGVEYVVRSLDRVVTLAPLLREGDVLVHLAGRAHVMDDRAASPLDAYRAANVAPTEILCRSAISAGVARFVFASSAKVFGGGRDLPYRHDDPLAPADPYAQSKAEAEQVVRDAGRSGRLDWTIIRPPFVYGPGGKGNFPRLLTLARLARVAPLPLASIRNQRSLVYVGNLVDAIMRIGMDPRGAGRVVLATDARDVSTPELLRAIAETRATRARLLPCPPSILRVGARLIGRSAEIERLTESLRLDSRYLQSEFGWTPPFTLEEALAESVGGSRVVGAARG